MVHKGTLHMVLNEQSSSEQIVVRKQPRLYSYHSPYGSLIANHTRDDLTNHSVQKQRTPTWHRRTPYLDSMRVGFIDAFTTISVWGIHRHSNRHTPQGSASCVQSFDDSLIVQFALRIAFRCVLHRCRNLDIRCWNCLVIDYLDNHVMTDRFRH